jgi:hypothetical protein
LGGCTIARLVLSCGKWLRRSPFIFATIRQTALETTQNLLGGKRNEVISPIRTGSTKFTLHWTCDNH